MGLGPIFKCCHRPTLDDAATVTDAGAYAWCEYTLTQEVTGSSPFTVMRNFVTEFTEFNGSEFNENIQEKNPNASGSFLVLVAVLISLLSFPTFFPVYLSWYVFISSFFVSMLNFSYNFTRERAQLLMYNRLCALFQEEMAHRSAVECLSGWSFLLLALGILFFTPATILAGMSAQHA